MPDFFSAIFVIIFILVIFLFIQNFLKGIRKDRNNRHSPELTVEATVVAKRIHVWGDHSHTDYYVTFQVASGDRMELEIPDTQYGYLVENDRGTLTFRGTEFLKFERT